MRNCVGVSICNMTAEAEMSSLKKEDFKKLLIENDDHETFCPKNFDFKKEQDRAERLAASIDKVTKNKSLVENHSINQDGPLFLRIVMHSGFSLAPLADVWISCFGNFALIKLIYPLRCDEVETIAQVVERSGYVLIPDDLLDEDYPGTNKCFVGKTWRARYFAGVAWSRSFPK